MRESELHRHIYAGNPALPGKVMVPPGDDMGMIRIGREAVLVTVDQLAAGVHVDLATATLRQVARKALARNLSDVAAMAALPSAAVVAASLPADWSHGQATALFDALREMADVFETPLMGGDISVWDHPLLLSVTVVAEPGGIEPVLRRGAQTGDAIYVTGELGGSLETVRGYTHHLDFEPRIDVARALAGEAATRPHAMIDLSDGLARDLERLCEASEVAADVDAEALPVSKACRAAAAGSGKAVWQHAIGDGEDYELLLAAREDMPSEAAGVPITRIGRICAAADDRPRVRVRLSDGRVTAAKELGWDHRGQA